MISSAGSKPRETIFFFTFINEMLHSMYNNVTVITSWDKVPALLSPTQ